jgi:phosphate acetyltransferase
MADKPKRGADPLTVVADPARRLLRPEAHSHERGSLLRELLRPANGLPPLATAVVHPCDVVSIGGALQAARAGLIVPLLVGPRARIERAAAQAGLSLDGQRIIDVPHSHAAAARGVQLVRAGEAAAILKGSLHTDELMAEVVHPDTGLRTERRISHVFVLDVPHYPKPLFVTDAAINIAPDLDTKRDIVQNAIDLCHAVGIARPKIALLAAVETVNSKMPSTVDAAALCKMADRGQITGGLLDGPLALDNAVSAEAARTKDIESPVAGDADVLVAPDLESGNMIAKQLVYLADALIAGLVLGARVPIMLTSRADDELSRLASCALALLHQRYRSRAGA